MILVSKTYEIVTPESAEEGDVAESGFEFEDEPLTFRELVGTLRYYHEASEWPLTNPSRYTWVTSYGEQNWRDGSYRNESLHFSHRNPARLEKYWVKALRYAMQRTQP